MSTSAIEWTNKVWNPTLGCTRVSAGCENCYAERLAHRLPAMGQAAYEGLTKKLPNGEVRWTGVVRAMPERLSIPLKWRKPARIFVDSMSDLFHEDVPDEFIRQVFLTMAFCYWHTFQVLTKRPERMRDFVLDFGRDGDQCRAAGVAYFFKQWGGRTPKANGRKLDGRTWDEYPQLEAPG